MVRTHARVRRVPRPTGPRRLSPPCHTLSVLVAGVPVEGRQGVHSGNWSTIHVASLFPRTCTSRAHSHLPQPLTCRRGDDLWAGSAAVRSGCLDRRRAIVPARSLWRTQQVAPWLQPRAHRARVHLRRAQTPTIAAGRRCTEGKAERWARAEGSPLSHPDHTPERRHFCPVTFNFFRALCKFRAVGRNQRFWLAGDAYS